MYLLEYLLGELIKNCMQHSRGIGYLHAQYFPSDGMFHVGIADDGVGVSGSYRLSESPRYKPGASEVYMLGEALTVESSSTTHRRDFQGQELFAIYSGDAFVFDDYGKADVIPMAPKKLGAAYGGVAVGLGFVRSAVGQTSFYQILNEVRIKLGLQKRDFSAERTGGFLS
jgi:hypothetical protein